MGHSTVRTTLNHHSHVYAEAQLGTAVKMADAIAEARRGVRKVCAIRAEATSRGRAVRAENRRAKRVFGEWAYWARTSDPQLVELVLSQLS